MCTNKKIETLPENNEVKQKWTSAVDKQILNNIIKVIIQFLAHHSMIIRLAISLCIVYCSFIVITNSNLIHPHTPDLAHGNNCKIKFAVAHVSS